LRYYGTCHCGAALNYLLVLQFDVTTKECTGVIMCLMYLASYLEATGITEPSFMRKNLRELLA
jgi:hypothetical protein